MAEQTVTERLEAVLAADVAGYARLMQADQRATVAALDECRAVFRESIEARHGRVVDMAGDSVLAVFETAGGAVEAALHIQKALTRRNQPLPEERRMRFRIGVHLGDIFEKADGTVYGNGVNIAARLQALAEPGGIEISGAVFDSVRDQIEARFDYVGERAVKNIDAPVRAYRMVPGGAKKARRPGARLGRRTPALLAVAAAFLVAGGVAWQSGLFRGERGTDAAEIAPALPTGPSIAVLPFANLSGESEQDYFSDGLTEDVIAALGRFSDLSVLARNATLPYKGQTVTPEEIGRALGVRYLLEGSVRRAGNQIRVSAQLTDATNGLHLWSNRYDREFEDVFAVQDDITRNVAGALAVEVTRVERERAVAKPTESLEAYDYVLRGWALLRQQTRSANFEAREMFERAIEMDPVYAAAYAGLGEAYNVAVAFGWTEFIVKSIEQAESLARKALTLDPSSVEARRLLASVHVQKGAFDLAAEQLQRALELNPSDAESYAEHAYVHLWSGHEEKAIEWYEAALRLDPNMEAGDMDDLAIAYYLSGRYGDAVATALETLKRSPDHFMAPAVLAAAYAQLGRDAEAAAAAKDELRVRPFFTVDWMVSSFSDPEDAAHMADGLKKAGLPKSAAKD